MGGNSVINNLTGACNGTYWNDTYISSKDLTSNLVWDGGFNTNWDHLDSGITLNEDYIKEIVEKITKNRELAKITPDEGPEIPKWTGFLPI